MSRGRKVKRVVLTSALVVAAVVVQAVVAAAILAALVSASGCVPRGSVVRDAQGYQADAAWHLHGHLEAARRLRVYAKERVAKAGDEGPTSVQKFEECREVARLALRLETSAPWRYQAELYVVGLAGEPPALPAPVPPDPDVLCKPTSTSAAARPPGGVDPHDSVVQQTVSTTNS